MSEAAKLCGNCGRYWTLKGGYIHPQSQWNTADLAGTCRHVAGQPFRLKEDAPIFCDCWVAP